MCRRLVLPGAWTDGSSAQCFGGKSQSPRLRPGRGGLYVGTPIQAAQFGGPVQTERGFVLHQPAGDWDCTIAVNGNTALTTSKDILEAVAQGQGPEKILVTLGFAGWSPGQLEDEISKNAWLTVEAQDSVIFDTPNADKLDAAMRLLGLDFAKFSEVAGHA